MLPFHMCFLKSLVQNNIDQWLLIADLEVEREKASRVFSLLVLNRTRLEVFDSKSKSKSKLAVEVAETGLYATRSKMGRSQR